MSWPVAAYGLLALTLAAGFAWYERTRPDAKVVALVGALAALAALGRMAFAAVPNVKPTTDIVIVAGLSLGGAPGFCVGAVAALASNFFFGQGPWTPWQMVGWGACGVIAALLARVMPGVFIRRWPLAFLCGVLGLLFPAFGDLGDWVTYSDHSSGQLGAYLASGLGFDLISAVSCVGFALLFGAALARSLARFRLRLDVRWVTPVLMLIVVLAVSSARLGGSDRAQAATADGVGGPVGYLERAPVLTPLFSGWAALGLEAAGVRPPARLVADLGTSAGSDPGSIERTILALAPLGDPVAELAVRLHPRPSVQGLTNLTAFAVLALRAAHRAVPSATLAWLRAQEDADGGFNFATRGAASDVDDTGAVLEALGDVPRAVAFLERAENRDGGFPASPGQSSNAQSTAFAVQGLIAAGRDPVRAVTYLRGLIRPDGSILYAAGNPQTPVWVTGEALMALAGHPLPLPPLPPLPAPSGALAPPPASPGPAAGSASASGPGASSRTVQAPPGGDQGTARRHLLRRAGPGPASPQPLARSLASLVGQMRALGAAVGSIFSL